MAGPFHHSALDRGFGGLIAGRVRHTVVGSLALFVIALGVAATDRRRRIQAGVCLACCA